MAVCSAAGLEEQLHDLKHDLELAKQAAGGAAGLQEQVRPRSRTPSHEMQ